MSVSASKRWAVATTAILLTTGNVAFAQDSQSTGWEFGGELYFWGASLGGSTTSGSDIDLGIGDIIDGLKFGAMGALAAHKGAWTVFGDMIYLDVGDSGSATVPIGPDLVVVKASMDLKGFISTAGVGYRFYDRGNTSLDVTGGIRYLWLDGTVDIRAPDLSQRIREEESGSNWDAVVGLRGRTDLNDKWYLTYYGDVGAGDSDLTWQAAAAVNYRLKRVDLTVGYRYLDFEFDDFGPFNDLNLSGAFAGVKIPF